MSRHAEYEARRARGVVKDGRRFGGPPRPYQPPDAPAGRSTSATWARAEQQIVIAAEVTIDSPDFGHLGPMVAATERELREAGVAEAPEWVVAGAGYWHQAQMEDIVTREIRVLVPPDANKRKGARPGWDGGLYAFLRRVLATDLGAGLYFAGALAERRHDLLGAGVAGGDTFDQAGVLLGIRRLPRQSVRVEEACGEQERRALPHP